MTTSSHPPFSHNPHVYSGVDPNGNPTAGLVVHSAVAQVEDAEVSDEDANVDVDGDGQIAGYETLSKAELVAECESRTPPLPTYGSKADIVARLQAADKATAEATVPEQDSGEDAEQA